MQKRALIALVILFFSLPVVPARALAEEKFPSPSSLVLDDPVNVVYVEVLSGERATYFELRGTVTHGIPEEKLEPHVLSAKPRIRVRGFSREGAPMGERTAVPSVAATTRLGFPTTGGGSAEFFMVQYPFRGYVRAQENTAWLCAESGGLRSCIAAPPPINAKPYAKKPLESKLEITFVKILTGRATKEPLLAAGGVAELVFPSKDDNYPLDLSIRVSMSDSLGNPLAKESMKARLFFLRTEKVINPATGEEKIFVVTLYQFGGLMPLKGAVTGVQAYLEAPPIAAREARTVFDVLDANRDGSISETDDLNGDGVVDHGDWQGVLPPS
jgi:hypothetical protein